MAIDLTTNPPLTEWRAMIDMRPVWRLDDVPAAQWQHRTRSELGLATDRPVVATGHQPLLWHPGILSKYMIADRYARATGASTANLIVDQHVGGFASFDVPITRSRTPQTVSPEPDTLNATADRVSADHAMSLLDVWSVELITPQADVPMARHAARRITSMPVLPRGAHLALPGLDESMCRIIRAINDAADAPNAAVQMARALDRLMQPWVAPMPLVCGSRLLRTGLARALLERMADDVQTCVRVYNDAVAAHPHAGLAPLHVDDDMVELPLWRIDAQHRRQRATLNDLRAFLAGDEANGPIDLMPRALLMTAILRLGVCDLFVHGTGGAQYDVVMEQWVNAWLGVRPSPYATVTATLRLPFDTPEDSVSLHREAHRRTALAHQLVHDPPAAEALDADHNATPSVHLPSDAKQQMLDAIDAAPRNSRERRARFDDMHRQLEALRRKHSAALSAVNDSAQFARLRIGEAPIRHRRDWAFALYPNPDIDALAQRAEDAVREATQTSSHDATPNATPAAASGTDADLCHCAHDA